MDGNAGSAPRTARRRARLASLAALALLLPATTCATTGLADLSRALPTRQYTLPSGLRVVVDEDPNANQVGVVWVVEAGLVDDTRHHGELAHTVEHLTFMLPDDKGASRWQRLRELGAVSVHGTTQVEQTQFQAFAPRGQLEALLAVELGQMADPLGHADDQALSAALVKERSVMAEESRFRDDFWFSEEWLLFSRLFPATHPYAAAGPSLAVDTESAFAVADARAFVRDHYRPQNMTLVLSGAIPPEWDGRLLAMMPRSLAGDPAARQLPQRRASIPSSAPIGREETMPLVATTRALPQVRVGWWLPGARGVDGASLEILGLVVNRALEWAMDAGELPFVVHADAYTLVTPSASMLACKLVLREGSRAEEARAHAINIVTRRVQSSLIRYGAARRTSLQEAALRAALQLQSPRTRATTHARLAHLDPGASLQALMAAYEGVSAGDVVDVARQYLTPEAVRSLLVLRAPNAAASGAPAVAQPAGDDAPAEIEADAARPAPGEVAVAHSAQEVRAAAAAVPVGGARVVRLRNGLTVIALRRPGLPFVSMVLGFREAPTRAAPAGVWLAARFGRNLDNAWGPLERGLLALEEWGPDKSLCEVHTYSSRAAEGLDYLGDRMTERSLKWPDDKFERWAFRAAAEQKTVDSQARGKFSAALWGDHPYGIHVSVVQVESLTQADVEDWIRRVERPDNGALVMVGDIDPDQMIARADSELRSAWKSDSLAGAPMAAPPAFAPARVGQAVTLQTMKEFGRKTATIRFGCQLPPLGRPRAGVVGDLLADLLQSKLFDRLRTEAGISYAPSVRYRTQWGGAAVLEGALDVNGEAVAAGMAAVQSYLKEGGEPFFDAAAFEAARWRLALANAASRSTNGAIARALFTTWKLGASPSALDQIPEQLATVSASDLDGALQACRASAVISAVVASEPPH